MHIQFQCFEQKLDYVGIGDYKHSDPAPSWYAINLFWIANVTCRYLVLLSKAEGGRVGVFHEAFLLLNIVLQTTDSK